MSSKIEWTDETWNPITGCSPCSPGCDHCYAKRMAQRLKGRYGYPADDPFRVTFHPDQLDKPLKWKKPRRVFVCSMGDLFHDDASFYDVERVFNVIDNHPNEPNVYPDHTYIILTKRPKRMKAFFEINEYLLLNKNIWLGVTVCNQQEADEKIPILLQIPAAVRFLSIEPMLSAIDISPYIGYYPIKNIRGGNTNENDQQRENNLSACPNGGIGNRQHGPNMEGEKEDGPENGRDDFNALQKSQGGTRMGGVPSSKGDDKLEKILLRSAQTRLSSFPRTDSRGNYDQSQEREKDSKLSRESGTGNLQPAGDSFNDGFGQQPEVAESVRRKKPSGQDIRCGSGGNQNNICEWGKNTNGVSQNIRGDFPDNFKDSAGRCKEKTKGSDERLHTQSKQDSQNTKSERPIHLVIVGGETGPGARPVKRRWIREIRDQCVSAGVPFFFKKYGDWWDKHRYSGDFPNDHGRLLDGREWSEYPNAD